MYYHLLASEFIDN